MRASSSVFLSSVCSRLPLAKRCRVRVTVAGGSWAIMPCSLCVGQHRPGWETFRQSLNHLRLSERLTVCPNDYPYFAWLTDGPSDRQTDRPTDETSDGRTNSRLTDRLSIRLPNGPMDIARRIDLV